MEDQGDTILSVTQLESKAITGPRNAILKLAGLQPDTEYLVQAGVRTDDQPVAWSEDMGAAMSQKFVFHTLTNSKWQ